MLRGLRTYVVGAVIRVRSKRDPCPCQNTQLEAEKNQLKFLPSLEAASQLEQLWLVGNQPLGCVAGSRGFKALGLWMALGLELIFHRTRRTVF